MLSVRGWYVGNAVLALNSEWVLATMERGGFFRAHVALIFS